MNYRCLICNVIVNSNKLETHLQIEHKWGKKRDPKGVDIWS